MTEDSFDPEHQKAETAASIAQIAAESGLGPTDRINLDLEFAPETEDADSAALIKALGSFGYLASETEDGSGVQAGVLDIPFTFEAIWTHEERTTTIARARGFAPDGWGFWEP
jgi:hypothetical protein